MKKYLIIIVGIVIFFYNCKSKSEKIVLKGKIIVEPTILIKDSTILKKKLLDTISKNKLPIGVFKLLSKDFNPNSESEKDQIEKRKLYQYYNSYELNIDSIRPILNKYFRKFYIPDNSSIMKKDEHPLLGDEGNSIFNDFFKAEKILPKTKDLYLMIFRGKTTSNDYEYFPIDRTDLVILDNKLTIVNKFNISYFYSSEDSFKYKYYYIDKNYNLYIRYYQGSEGQESSFSNIETYQILDNGNIVPK